MSRPGTGGEIPTSAAVPPRAALRHRAPRTEPVEAAAPGGLCTCSRVMEGLIGIWGAPVAWMAIALRVCMQLPCTGSMHTHL